MVRVKRGEHTRKKHNKEMKITKGHTGRRNNTIRASIQAGHRALNYNYISRKLKKRNYRSLWIQIINSYSILHKKQSYSKIINILTNNNIIINRKVLASLISTEPTTFVALMNYFK